MNYAFTAIEKLEYLYGDLSPERLAFYNKNFTSCQNSYGFYDGSYAERIHYWKRYIYNLLKTDPDTRQAIITIYGPQDRHSSKDIPCTIMQHFMIREGKLNLTVYMRSNDLLWGFPYDVNAFCFLQEALAAMLGIEMGTYTHIAGSLHSYDEREGQLTSLLSSHTLLDIQNPVLEKMDYEEMMKHLKLFWYIEHLFRVDEMKVVPNNLTEFLPESLQKYLEVVTTHILKKKAAK
jgi:thymidylate synthase